MSGALKRDEWETVRLGDVFELQMGKTPSRDVLEYWNNGDNPWVSISDLSTYSKYVGGTKETISNLGVDKSGIKKVPPNTVIMSFKLSIGKTAITTDYVYTNEAIMAFIPKETRIFDTSYLYYLLSGINWDKGVSKAVKGKTLNKQYLSTYNIPLPPLDIQRQIADTLDKVTELITLRKTQLEKLDELVKAWFVEMFGEPVLNPKDWECKTVIDECDCMVPGRDKPKSFTGDIPWITIEDLAVNGVTYESKRGLGLTQEEIDEVNRKTIPKGSVIMSCVGNLGICSIAGKEMIINQQLHSFQCGERINNVFLMNYLGYRKDFMNKWASNTTVLYMNKSICNSIPVIIPPIELQEQFAAFVEQTDKSKSIIQQSLDTLETLKKSLMQEYFG